MKILNWRKKQNVSSVDDKRNISYTTITGQVICISREEIKSAPRYKTLFGRVTGIMNQRSSLK